MPPTAPRAPRTGRAGTAIDDRATTAAEPVEVVVDLHAGWPGDPFYGSPTASSAPGTLPVDHVRVYEAG